MAPRAALTTRKGHSHQRWRHSMPATPRARPAPSSPPTAAASRRRSRSSWPALPTRRRACQQGCVKIQEQPTRTSLAYPYLPVRCLYTRLKRAHQRSVRRPERPHRRGVHLRPVAAALPAQPAPLGGDVPTAQLRLQPRDPAQLRAKRKGTADRKWHADETHVKIHGIWCYLYRSHPHRQQPGGFHAERAQGHGRHQALFPARTRWPGTHRRS